MILELKNIIKTNKIEFQKKLEEFKNAFKDNKAEIQSKVEERFFWIKINNIYIIPLILFLFNNSKIIVS